MHFSLSSLFADGANQADQGIYNKAFDQQQYTEHDIKCFNIDPDKEWCIDPHDHSYNTTGQRQLEVEHDSSTSHIDKAFRSKRGGHTVPIEPRTETQKRVRTVFTASDTTKTPSSSTVQRNLSLPVQALPPLADATPCDEPGHVHVFIPIDDGYGEHQRICLSSHSPPLEE